MVPSSGSTIQRWVRSAPFDLAALLHEEAVAGAGAGQLGKEDLLGAGVGGADEIGRAFERDLELLDLAEIARQAAARLAGGGEHDIHQGRGGHVDRCC